MNKEKNINDGCSISIREKDKYRLNNLILALEDDGVSTHKDAVRYVLDYYFVTNDQMKIRGIYGNK